MELQEISIKDSDFENIDGAVLDWVSGMKLKTTTNKGFVDVPVIWQGSERAYQKKHNPELRDNIDAMVFPVCVVARTSIAKNREFKGTVWADVMPSRDEKRGVITIARIIKSDKSHNFASATTKRIHGQFNYPRKNNKVVYETIEIPIPVYLEMHYSIILKTDFQEQMNDIVTPFITRPGGTNHVLLQRNNLRYEAFIEAGMDIENNHANLGEEEPKYSTTIDLKVLGYLIGDGKNQMTPRIVRRENAVEVKLPRERVMTGDEPDFPGKDYVGIR